MTIVANECRQRRRGRWWNVIKGQPLPDIAGPDPDCCLAAAELRRALARLRPDMRLVIVLRYYLDLPFGDMGRVLGDVQCGQLCPGEITVGPDGALWFVDTQLGGAGGIGRITTAGAITLSPMPGPVRIAAGADGNLWFAESRGSGDIGRITPAGQVTQFTVRGLQQAPGAVQAVAAGPDGAIWFTVGQAPGSPNPAATTTPGQIGRIAPDGSITLFAPPGEGATGPIVRGPDGNLWAFGSTTVTRIVVS
jgi:hypothetical protein